MELGERKGRVPGLLGQRPAQGSPQLGERITEVFDLLAREVRGPFYGAWDTPRTLPEEEALQGKRHLHFALVRRPSGPPDQSGGFWRRADRGDAAWQRL